MKKTLYLHIGCHKTATSTIQVCCVQNRALLQEKNIFYPILDSSHYGHPFIVEDMNVLFARINNAEYQQNLLMDLLKKNTATNVLISSETFFHTEPCLLDWLCDLFDTVYIIVYFRNVFSLQNAFLQTIYQMQHYAIGNPLFNPHETSKLPDFIEKFGQSSCIIKNYDNLSATGNLLDDFFHTLGIHDTSDFVYPQNQNISLKTAYTFFLRHLANAPLTFALWNECIWTLQELSQVDVHAPRYMLVPESVWQANKEQIDAQIQYEAELLQDPSWPEYCYAQKNKLLPCPYTQLPPAEQHRIFSALPPHLQQAIIKAWPLAENAQPHEPLLPPIFENETVNTVLFRFRRTAFEKEKEQLRLDKQHLEQQKEMFALLLNHPALQTLYSFTEATPITPFNHIYQTSWQDTIFHFTSTGNDPIFMLPDIHLPLNATCFMHICGEGLSERWNLFYLTKNYTTHTELQTIRFDPRKTPNQPHGGLFLLPPDALGNGLRLDPGDTHGQYRITKFAIYAISLSDEKTLSDEGS